MKNQIKKWIYDSIFFCNRCDLNHGKERKINEKRLKIHPVCIRLVYLFLHSCLEEFVGPLNCSSSTDVSLAQRTTEFTKNSLTRLKGFSPWAPMVTF